MRIVVVEVKQVSDDKPGAINISIEHKRGESWARESSSTAETGMVDARRSILLEDDQRIVIEGRQAEASPVYDKEQMAAVPAKNLMEKHQTRTEEEKQRLKEDEAKEEGEAEKRRQAAMSQAKQRQTESAKPAAPASPRPSTVHGTRSSRDT